MKIQVKIIKENADGSANAQVDFDKDGLEVLVQWGLVALLESAVDKYKVEAEVDLKPVKKRKQNEHIFTGSLASDRRKASGSRSKK